MDERELPVVKIYTDGGAEPNPGKGGFGVIMTFGDYVKEFSIGYTITTNNRMELMGVIFALEKLKKPCKVTIYTDSQYVINGISKGWAKKWKAKNWRKSDKTLASNIDLWDKLLNLIDVQLEVNFIWVKGHAGHKENERCDELATAAMKKSDLLPDLGYFDEVEIEQQGVELSQVKSTLKAKIKNEGDLCRKCSTPVVKRQSSKLKSISANQNYYFKYHIFCPNCKTTYMVEEAKVWLDKNRNPDLFP